MNKLIFNPILYLKIRKKLKQYKPDWIIVNTTFVSPITQLKALKGYKNIQIIHDYSIVCPKSTCIKENYVICNGYKYNNCIKECKYHNSKLQMFLKLYITKRIEKIRKKIFNYNISPSEKLAEYVKKYEYKNVSCINNPIDLTMFNESYKENDKKISYIYVGNINKRKGIFNFITAFNEFSCNKDVELIIIGKFTSMENEKEFNKLVSNNKKIKYLGYKENKDAIQIVKEANFSVVPSIWMENYPTTILEAMASKTLVIGSDRGGIPQLLDDNRGIVFDILDYDKIISTLNYTYIMSKNQYDSIVNNAYEYIKNNNSYDTYLKRIDEILKKE